MLVQLRQFSQSFGRTLLGMLLFVWLTMALAPCVMANSVSFAQQTQTQADIDSEMSVLHEKMQQCSYCPDKNHTMSTVVLCQNSHVNVSDTMNFMVDSIDIDSFVLFEIPASLQINPVLVSNIASYFHQVPDHNTLAPLDVTGILRI